MAARKPECPAKLWRPSAVTIWSIFLLVVIIFVVAFLSGYVPLQKRRAVIAGEAHEQERALPRVEVIEVGRASGKSMLQLPGNIQAITEAPILARAEGYVLRRMVDIGDRVQAGQTVAEIEAPEMEAAGSSVEGQFAAGAGGGGSGAGQLQPGEVRHRTGSRDGAALDQPGWPRVWSRDRRTISIRANINRASQASSRSKRRSASNAAMWLPRKRTWRGSRECRPILW